MKKRYKILSVILALAIVLGSIVTISVFSTSAEQFTDENGITWTLTESYPGWAIAPTNISTISGDIVIPETYKDKVITVIADNAFKGCTGITSITMHDNIGYLGQYAFANCSNLKTINLSDNITEINQYAFQKCSSLTSVEFPAKLTTIETKAFSETGLTGELVVPEGVITIKENAFENCDNLTSVVIPGSASELEAMSFNFCDNITKVVFNEGIKEATGFKSCPKLSSISIPNSVTTIGEYAFAGSAISSIDIPNEVTTIKNSAFSGCKNLTNITLPDKLTTIENSAFNEAGLTSITIPDSVTKIGYRAFIASKLKSVVLGDGISEIEDSVFYNCKSLTSVYIPEGITKIGSSAFESCKLTSVNIPNSVTIIDDRAFWNSSLSGALTIPNGVTKIGSKAFYACLSLTSVSFPDSVTTIEDEAFYKCSKLASITMPDGGIEYIGKNAFPEKYTEYNTTTSTFTDDSGISWTIEQYHNTCEIKPTNISSISGDITVPATYGNFIVNKISVNAFRNCSSITSVVIPNGVTTIDEFAFSHCTNLTNITIPDSVTSIGRGAFSYSGITSITIPDSVSYLGREAFLNCTNLKSAKLSNNLTTIESSLLSGCKNLISVSNFDRVTSIGDNAFTGCESLKAIDIPDSVKTIGKWAFSGCRNSSNKIIIPKGVTRIEEYAFHACNSLRSIIIPDSVTFIGNFAFSECSNLSDVVIPENVTEIGKFAFQSCYGISSINIPNRITAISPSTFAFCQNLQSVNIPNSITVIGDSAFRNCTRLNNVTIPDSVKIIDKYAFDKCVNAFDSITIGKNIEYVADYAFANLGELDTLTIENKKTSDIAVSAFYNDTFKNLEVADTVEEIDTPLLSGNKNFASVGLGSNITNITDNAFFGNSNMSITAPENADVVIDYANKNNIPITITSAVEMDKPVDFEVTCDKSGYEFTVYRVADLESGVNPYEIRYNSLIAEIEDEIFEGDSVAMLEELDKIDSSVFTEVVGTYNTDVDGSSKMFEDLPAGIYYVRATNFPANVYSVQNSVFALPYYVEESNWWTYSLSPIPLATKVDESNPEIVKTITNSTKDNVNFTDVSLGDTVNFEIEASRVGSANVVESKDFKLKSYVVSDIMESGLTLNQDSFVVTLEDIDGNTLATLENTTDYVVNIVANEGADTTFTVSLTPEYLAQDEFYSSANVVIAYSAVLNKYSTREFDGNFNTATDLTYSNKTNVTSTVEGNTVYAYTFGIEVNKYDDAGTPLAGSEFGLYLTEDDAKVMKNAIATGTSTDTGKVEFFTESNDVIRLASGTYYIVETKATENYNRYTDVIPVTITAEYSDTETNGTYLLSAPENGIQLVEVKNSKVVIPNTGGDGAMYRYLIALAFAMLAVTLVVLKKRSTKKATATK